MGRPGNGQPQSLGRPERSCLRTSSVSPNRHSICFDPHNVESSLFDVQCSIFNASRAFCKTERIIRKLYMYQQLCGTSFKAHGIWGRKCWSGRKQPCCLAARDSRQTQAHLSQLALYPIAEDYQHDSQPLSSHHSASDASVRLMPISPLKRYGNQFVHFRGRCACRCSYTTLQNGLMTRPHEHRLGNVLSKQEGQSDL